MTQIYLQFRCAHYLLYGNTPVVVYAAASGGGIDWPAQIVSLLPTSTPPQHSVTLCLSGCIQGDLACYW